MKKQARSKQRIRGFMFIDWVRGCFFIIVLIGRRMALWCRNGRLVCRRGLIRPPVQGRHILLCRLAVVLVTCGLWLVTGGLYRVRPLARWFIVQALVPWAGASFRCRPLRSVACFSKEFTQELDGSIYVLILSYRYLPAVAAVAWLMAGRNVARLRLIAEPDQGTPLTVWMQLCGDIESGDRNGDQQTQCMAGTITASAG